MDNWTVAEVGEEVSLEDAREASMEIQEATGINILTGNIPVSVILTDDGEIVGMLWAGDDDGEFSFDVAVLPEHQGDGKGSELIDYGMQMYYNEYNDSELKVDVVNPSLAEHLSDEYGLKVIDRDGEHITMSLDNDDSPWSDEMDMLESKWKTKNA